MANFDYDEENDRWIINFPINEGDVIEKYNQAIDLWIDVVDAQGNQMINGGIKRNQGKMTPNAANGIQAQFE